MTRFLHESAGTNWIAWLVVFAILSTPFFWEKAREAPFLYQMILNFFITLLLPGMFTPTNVGRNGNGVMSLAIFVGFGVGYSLLAFRKDSLFERISGGVFLLILLLVIMNRVIELLPKA